MKHFFKKNIWFDVAVLVATILLVVLLVFDFIYGDKNSGLWIAKGFTVIAVTLLLQSLGMFVYAIYSLAVKKYKLGIWAIVYLAVLLLMAYGALCLFGVSLIKGL